MITTTTAHATERALPQPGRSYLFSKRALDLSGALLLLLLTSPILLAAALAIRCSSRGPVLFWQTRVGLNGRPFRVMKFRTMANGRGLTDEQHETFAEQFKLDHDPRVTLVGRVLRRTSIDELPQLLNVIAGQMSLVGPRPVVPAELATKYGELGRELVSVRPGLTGLWQVSGRSTLTYEQRVALDIDYVRRRSLPLDLAILAQTPWAVLSGRGAH